MSLWHRYASVACLAVFLGVIGAYLFFRWSFDYASVSQVATMTTTKPIWVALSNLVLNKQAISVPKVLTGAVAIEASWGFWHGPGRP